jgi:PAS domain S-box-containing protein
MKTTHKFFALFAGLTILVGLGIVGSFWAFDQIQATSTARKHSRRVIGVAGDLLAALTDAENGERGYLLTGEEKFLGPYLTVNRRAHDHLGEMQKQNAISSARKVLLVLAPLVETKLANMTQNVESRRIQNLPEMLENFRRGAGGRLMDAIRSEVRDFIRIQEEALVEHERKFQLTMQTLFSIIVAASLSMLLLPLAIAYLVDRDAQHQVKQAVHLETQNLCKVQEETNKELQEVNFTLQASEERLAVTLKSIGDAVIATDAEGRVTILNPLAEKLTGWKQAEALNCPVNEIFRIINQETRKPSVVPIKAALQHGTIQGLANHTILISRDGEECAIADSCAPISDRYGQVVGAVLVFRDVTEESLAQQLLCDNATLIQTILNTVVDGIITIRAAGGLIETVNPAGERMFGYSAVELIGQNFTLLIPELDRDQVHGSLEYYRPSDGAKAAGLGREVLGKRKDGSVFPLEIAVSEMWQGGQRHFTGILRDISARQAAEEALLKAGALQKAIFNSANFSSIATDAAGVIQIFNVGAERMLGYAAADVMNKITPADISDPHEVVARAEALSVELATPITPGFEALVFKASRGIEDIYELTYIRKDGSRFPAVVSVTALRDDQNAIIGYLLIGTDNTARKQIEEEQKQLAQRLRDHQFYTRSLFEANMDALMTTDPAGIITDVNKQMEALTGCTRDELIGSPNKNYFTNPDRAEDSIKQVLKEKKLNNYELTARARDGKETVVSFNATTFYDRDRKLQGVFAAARDITEQRHLDRVLQEKNLELEGARSVAEKANLAKSEFLSSMSHELRSPLNAILGFAQLMESDSPPPTTGQVESIVQILKAGWHLLKLIDEILDLAKIESGRVPLSWEPVLLSEVIIECQGMTETQAQQRGIRMVFPQFEKPCFVRADRTRLKQVVINLLSNAIKYNKKEGMVEMKISETTPQRLRVSIVDAGIGMNADQLSQLFQPFNRLGQEDGGAEGTGIGLVVAKRLVELMGGVIGVESTVGQGSVFWFELDLVAPQVLAEEEIQAAAQPLPHVSIGTRQRTLLYIEDNPANLKLVEQIIARHPYIHMVTAINGITGIEMAFRSKPDVILTDINLPDINGFEVLKNLRADPVTAHIPIIALSANAMPHVVERGLMAGFFRYVTKPVKVLELVEALDVALAFAEEQVEKTV